MHFIELTFRATDECLFVELYILASCHHDSSYGYSVGHICPLKFRNRYSNIVTTFRNKFSSLFAEECHVNIGKHADCLFDGEYYVKL